MCHETNNTAKFKETGILFESNVSRFIVYHCKIVSLLTVFYSIKTKWQFRT